jgi:hypothetical protein
MSASVATPKKAAAAKPKIAKKPAEHPKYTEMIAAAVGSLKERGGSSRQAILKYIVKHYNVGKDERVVNQHLKMALRAGVKKGALKQSKGSGASGSFRLGDKVAPNKKAVVAKKPKAAGAVVKKTKKTKSPKKAKKPKSPAKAKKPVVAKAKKPKTPAKAKKPAAVKAKKTKTPVKAKKATKKAAPKKAAPKKA